MVNWTFTELEEIQWWEEEAEEQWQDKAYKEWEKKLAEAAKIVPMDEDDEEPEAEQPQETKAWRSGNRVFIKY